MRISIRLSTTAGLNASEILAKITSSLVVCDKKKGKLCCLPDFYVKNKNGNLSIKKMISDENDGTSILEVSNIDENIQEIINKIINKILAVIDVHKTLIEYNVYPLPELK